jgi:hypothetical protein
MLHPVGCVAWQRTATTAWPCSSAGQARSSSKLLTRLDQAIERASEPPENTEIEFPLTTVQSVLVHPDC